MTDALSDPAVQAALRVAGARARYGDQQLCPRCTKNYLPSKGSADVCTVCTDELDAAGRARKRKYARRRHAQGATALVRAMTWLRQELSMYGPSPSSQIKAHADEDGISTSTLHRARQELGIVHWREGNGPDHQTIWALERQVTRANADDDGTSER